MSSAKDAARQIIEHLPEQATWDDIMWDKQQAPRERCFCCGCGSCAGVWC